MILICVFEGELMLSIMKRRESSLLCLMVMLKHMQMMIIVLILKDVVYYIFKLEFHIKHKSFAACNLLLVRLLIALLVACNLFSRETKMKRDTQREKL